MKQNRFKIVIPSYNNEKWLEPNLASILSQTYTNYEVLYIDDCSTDDTYGTVKHIVANLPNWKVVKNETNMRRGFNISPYNEHIKNFITDDEDVLVFVDGDDWLYDDYVLEQLNEFYNKGDYWMTYGKMICYPGGEEGNPQNSLYSDAVHKANAYRRDHWRASHLRTFKWHLYKQIKKEDLCYSKTGEYYFHAEDLATSYPCLEMCPQSKIGVLDFCSYVFNATPSNRERGIAREKEAGMDLENEIRSKDPYEMLGFEKCIINILSGGLGNMMFQLAAAYALAKKYNHTLLLNPNHVGTLHKAPMEYKDSIFKKIEVPSKPLEFYKISEESFNYKPLGSLDENIILDGYFQSYKYFNDYQNEIKDLFSFEVDSRYDPKEKVSVHIRRGNYTQLSQHHHNLSISYYLNAIEQFSNHNFLVFSDDIEWCKEQFLGSRYIFVEDTTDVEDLYLMSQCDHNIIANSTFSWWGAFLNQNPNKKVIHPDKWFGPVNSNISTKDLFPKDWICMNEIRN